MVGGDNPAANRSFYTGMRLFTGSMIAPPVSERGEAGRYIEYSHPFLKEAFELG